MSLADIIYRIATDPPFAAKMRCDPTTTLTAAGLNLEDSRTEAFLAILQSNNCWEELCSARLTRLSEPGWWAAQSELYMRLPEP
jgi:hypothetical protein